jgi:hypothetical protein
MQASLRGFVTLFLIPSLFILPKTSDAMGPPSFQPPQSLFREEALTHSPLWEIGPLISHTQASRLRRNTLVIWSSKENAEYKSWNHYLRIHTKSQPAIRYLTPLIVLVCQKVEKLFAVMPEMGYLSLFNPRRYFSAKRPGLFYSPSRGKILLDVDNLVSVFLNGPQSESSRTSQQWEKWAGLSVALLAHSGWHLVGDNGGVYFLNPKDKQKLRKERNKLAEAYGIRAHHRRNRLRGSLKLILEAEGDLRAEKGRAALGMQGQERTMLGEGIYLQLKEMRDAHIIQSAPFSIHYYINLAWYLVMLELNGPLERAQLLQKEVDGLLRINHRNYRIVISFLKYFRKYVAALGTIDRTSLLLSHAS